jgi:adenylyl-sulfate kinase
MAQGCVVWLTGLSGAGKSALATAVLPALAARDVPAELIDGRDARRMFGEGLGYTREDREALVRRTGFLAGRLARHGVVVLAALTSPHRAAREAARPSAPDFLEVFVRCPIEVLLVRDEKGLYRRALSGEIDHFPGVSEVYEAPPAPDVVVDREYHTLEDGVSRILQALERRGSIPQVTNRRVLRCMPQLVTA